MAWSALFLLDCWLSWAAGFACLLARVYLDIACRDRGNAAGLCMKLYIYAYLNRQRVF